MAYNHQQVPFWDFVRSFDQQGAGVDRPEAPNFFGPSPHHPPGAHPPPPPPGAFQFGGPWSHFGFGRPGGPRGWGGPEGPGTCRGGRRGRQCHRESGERSRTASPNPEGAEGEKTDSENREAPSGGEERHGPRGFGRRGGRGGHGHHGRGGWGHHGRRGPPPPFGGLGFGGFDMGGLLNSLNSHPVAQQPWAQMLRQYAEHYGLGGTARSGETLVPEDVDAESTFVPPIDVFSTETAYVLHIALPGAKKEDVGVNFDADKGVLNVAGVVYRQGDEEFLKTLSQSERKVGVFERFVKLPPGDEEKEEVDGDAITAKLEDGVLVVTVPKVEKEWTEVKRVDIE